MLLRLLVVTLRTRKRMKKNNKKGFTLAELLIVVAIIAVLTAIAIPVFGTQLEKSREATDLANVRAAYAEQVTAFLGGDGSTDIPAIEVPAKQTQANWQTANDSATTTIAEGQTGSGISVPAITNHYTVSVNATNGSITIS